MLSGKTRKNNGKTLGKYSDFSLARFSRDGIIRAVEASIHSCRLIATSPRMALAAARAGAMSREPFARETRHEPPFAKRIYPGRVTRRDRHHRRADRRASAGTHQGAAIGANAQVPL